MLTRLYEEKLDEYRSKLLGKEKEERILGKITDHLYCTNRLDVHIRQVDAVRLGRWRLLQSTPEVYVSDNRLMIGLCTANSPMRYRLIARR